MKPMTGPLSRIIRAKEHLDSLNSEVAAFTASNPYHVDIDDDLQDGSYICYPYLTKAFPPNLGILVGEIFHQLRSALDNIAYSLAIVKDERVEFPIFIKNETGFANKLKKLREDARADVEAMQPYHRPNGEKHRHPLSVLSRIDIVDKHRIIIPGINKIWVASGFPNKFFTADFAFTGLNKGDIVYKLTLSPDLKKNFQPEVKVQILFDVSTGCPDDAKNIIRITGADISRIYHYIRDIIYPRFAKFLEPEDSLS